MSHLDLYLCNETDYCGLLKTPRRWLFCRWKKRDGSYRVFTCHSLLRVIKALDELHSCTLARSTWANEGCCLPCRYCNTELIQDLRRTPAQSWPPSMVHQTWILLLYAVPWLQAWMGSKMSHCETQCLLWPCPVYIQLQTDSLSEAPVSIRHQLKILVHLRHKILAVAVSCSLCQ